MPDLYYTKLPGNLAQVECLCGWKSESFTRGPFDPAEALVAYSTVHTECFVKSPPPTKVTSGIGEYIRSLESPCILVWPWNEAPQTLKNHVMCDGDEDGIVWIPHEFLEGSASLYESTDGWQNITRLWQDDIKPELIRFQDGLLVVWRHA